MSGLYFDFFNDILKARFLLLSSSLLIWLRGGVILVDLGFLPDILKYSWIARGVDTKLPHNRDNGCRAISISERSCRSQ